MRRALLLSLATSLAIAAGCAADPPPNATTPTAPDGKAPSASSPGPAGEPTPEEAKKFLDGVDSDLRRLWVASQRASWVNQNFITDDTEAVSATAEEASMEFLTRTINASKRYDKLELSQPLARQLKLLKLAALLPAPTDARERAELAEISVWMGSTYGKGKYCPPRLKGECLSLGKLSNIMDKSRNWDDLTDAWTGWHAIAPPIREKFKRYVELGNKGSKEIGFKDLGALWRSGYDMSADAFEGDVHRLWTEVKPLYDELHCYVRGKLRNKYGKEKIGEKAPIPAHILGNMWAQEWSNIYDLAEPYKGQGSLDISAKLKRVKSKDPKEKDGQEKELVRMGEKFFTSLGLDPLPKTFWERSLFKKPADREVVCHASAWDVGFNNDLRIKMCIEPKEEDLITIHHELGHDYYFHYYFELPVLFQQGANDGFHEGIGDTLALSVTPAYLKSIGLLDKVPTDEKGDINVLFKSALDKVAFLPFGMLIDQWRWDVFSGKTAPENYNKAWWDLRLKYQGVAPPVARSEKDFDPGAKFHVPGNTPYVRYFLARLYQFQFHRALCQAAGQTGPLHKCSIYGSKPAGAKLRAMLAMGASRPWPEALKAMSGETKADAGAMLEYFAPLQKWLKEQNKGEKCGW